MPEQDSSESIENIRQLRKDIAPIYYKLMQKIPTEMSFSSAILEFNSNLISAAYNLNLIAVKKEKGKIRYTSRNLIKLIEDVFACTEEDAKNYYNAVQLARKKKSIDSEIFSNLKYPLKGYFPKLKPEEGERIQFDKAQEHLAIILSAKHLDEKGKLAFGYVLENLKKAQEAGWGTKWGSIDELLEQVKSSLPQEDLTVLNKEYELNLEKDLYKILEQLVLDGKDEKKDEHEEFKREEQKRYQAAVKTLKSAIKNKKLNEAARRQVGLYLNMIKPDMVKEFGITPVWQAAELMRELHGAIPEAQLNKMAPMYGAKDFNDLAAKYGFKPDKRPKKVKRKKEQEVSAADLEEIINKLRTRLEEVKKERDTVQTAYDELDIDYQKLETEKVELEQSLREEKSKDKIVKKEFDEHCKTIEKELADAIAARDEYDAEREILQKERDELRQKTKSYESKSKQLEAEIKKLEDQIKTDEQELTKEYESIQKERDDWKNKYETTEEKVTKLEEQVAKYQGGATKEELEALEKELKVVTVSDQKIRKLAKGLNNKYKRAKAELEQKEGTLKNLEETVNNLQAQLGEKEQELTLAKEEIKRYEDQLKAEEAEEVVLEELELLDYEPPKEEEPKPEELEELELLDEQEELEELELLD